MKKQLVFNDRCESVGINIDFEIRGTIKEIFEYPVMLDGKVISMEKGIIIESNNLDEPVISEAYRGRDYSHFSVGQNVVSVVYSFPDGTGSIAPICATYDEKEYDEMMAAKKGGEMVLIKSTRSVVKWK